MKKTGLLISLLLILLTAGKNTAQSLACNDLVQVSLDHDCSYTLVPEDILEGILFSDCIVELDKTVPFGTGPWEAPVLGVADVGKTYLARVTHLPSGNSCWGNVKAEDKLPPVLICDGVSTINLDAGGTISFATTDLSITAMDGCGAMNLSPATLQYDCGDVGVNIVSLTATDAYGNVSTCQHTVLVANSTDCQTCLSNCPQSLTVTYDEGNSNLLPAFQSNDWSVFDAYGTALFDPACTSLDSIFTMNYQVGGAGQSWFTRQWFWLTNVGQFIICEQSIVFPATHTVTVQGKVYLDSDNDCISDAGEQGVQLFDLVLTKLPSGVSETIHPKPDGTYSKNIVFSAQDASAELHLVAPPNVNPGCPSALSIPNSTSTPAYNFDIGLQSEGNCPIMQVDLGNLFTRRCATNYFKVNYCNVGLDTAVGAYVTVNLDPLISLQSADLPYTVSGADSIYTFQLGDVPPFYCGSIVLYAHVSCNAVPGQTLCSEANIYPDVPCNGAWQGAEVSATAYCSGDSVSLTLRNIGQQDMALPLNYIVVEDFIMYKGGTFQLATGDSITIKTPASGATWRIEAEQTPGFPVDGLVAAAIEGCGGLNSPGLINLYPPGDNAITYDQYCSEVVASCDPNDKTAVPVGFNDQHLIRANGTIEYKIRFQNTGTDTAFRVVIVDTLSPLLDARTLETGASSHPYRLDIYPGNILHFVFQPIVLPDSNVNEVASHGYVQFRIAQQPDLADGTVIENTAAIYFDQNEPVFTNTAFHTIGYPYIQVDPLSYSIATLSPSCNGSADGAIFVAASGGVAPYSFLWSDPNLQGDSLTGLPAGTYHLTLTDSKGSQFSEIFTLTEPAPVVVAMSSTPAVDNQNNGAASAVASGGIAPYSYLWSNGATTENLSGLSAGVYTVIVTDANGCATTNSVRVEQVVATDDPGTLSRIRVWPNPAHDRIMLDLHEVLPQLLRLDVLSADGRVLRQFGIKELQPLFALNLENEPTGGLILLVLRGQDGSIFTEKIVIR